MKEILEERERQWGIKNSSDMKNSGEEDELKNFCPFLSFEMMTWNVSSEVIFLIDEVARKPPNEHVNSPK